MTCSTTAWSRCSASTSVMSSVRLVMNAKCRQSGTSSACGPIRRVRRTINRRPAVDGLGDLRLTALGVVVDRLPGVLGDRLDGRFDLLDVAHADRVLPAGLLEQLEDLGVPEPRVGAQQHRAGRAGALDAGDQLLAEALDPLLRVRRSLPQPDVQRLAGVGAGGEDRVVAEQLGVSVGGALLLVAADLADEAVDVDDQPPVAGARAGLPGPLDRLPEQRVELAHVPERERPQKRSKRRRRRDPSPEQPPRAPGAQYAACRRCCRRRAPSRTAAPSPCAPRSPRPAGRGAAAPTLPPTPRSRAAARASRRASRPRPNDPLSSNSTRTPSSPTASSSCTMKVTS